jgi:hypothetical protein
MNNRPNLPSRIAVFIYEYSRAYMWKNVFKNYNVYYSDTDSCLIDLTNFNEWLRLKRTIKLNGYLQTFCDFLIANRNTIIQNITDMYLKKGKLLTPTEIAIEIAQQIFILIPKNNERNMTLRSSI